MECSSIEPFDEESMPGIWCCPSPLSLYLPRCSARPCKPYTAGWGAAAGKPENKRINTRSVSKAIASKNAILLGKRIGLRIYFFVLSRVLISFSACLHGFLCIRLSIYCVALFGLASFIQMNTFQVAECLCSHPANRI